MLSLVKTGRLTRFSVGVQFQNLYSTDYYTPPSFGAPWFLPPSSTRSGIGDWGAGKVTALTWIEGENEPVPQPDTEVYDDESNQKVEPWEEAAKAVHNLGKDIRTASTRIVWWAGILLSTTVFASLFK